MGLLYGDGYSQVKKIYGFVQELYSGVRQEKDISAESAGIDKPISSTQKRYFIFSENKKNSSVLFIQIWIKGSFYNFSKESVAKTPVIFEFSDGNGPVFKDTLIKSSKEIIIRFNNLVKKENTLVPVGIKKLVCSNDVVVFYKYKKQTFNFVLRKLKVLNRFLLHKN